MIGMLCIRRRLLSAAGRRCRSLHIDVQAANQFDAGSVIVIPDFISQDEHDNLVRECEPSLRKRRYEEGHWDAVIHKFREVEKYQWSSEAAKIFDRVKTQAPLTPELLMLPGVHVLDIAADGYIDPHVDSIKFSGDFVIGISLLSSSVMTLTKNQQITNTYGQPSEEISDVEESIVRLLLPPRSLYILGGEARYEYAHAIVGAKDGPQLWVHESGDEQVVERDRRISLIMRDEKI